MDPNNQTSLSRESFDIFKFETDSEYYRGYAVEVDLTLQREKKACESLAQLGVTTKNERLQGSGAKFEFIRVVSASARSFFDGRIKFKLKYIAKNTLQGKQNVCESIVLFGNEKSNGNGILKDESLGFRILNDRQ